MNKKLTDHDLLIRIDERQGTMNDKINSICGKLDLKVDDDEDYKEVEREAKSWRDTKNKMIGWGVGIALGGGATGGLISTLVKGLVEGVFAK